MAMFKTPEDYVQWHKELLALLREGKERTVGDEAVRKVDAAFCELQRIPEMPEEIRVQLYELRALALEIRDKEVVYRMEQERIIRSKIEHVMDCECPWPRQTEDYVM